MTRVEELANPDLVATFIDRIEDVTELVRNVKIHKAKRTWWPKPRMATASTRGGSV